MSKQYVTTAEHAANIRAEIKAAIKSGALPAGIKVSTRTKSYSGGSSITVEVTALPAGFGLLNPARVAHERANPSSWHCEPRGEWCDRYSPAGAAVLATLTAIVDAHHEDNSTDDGGDRCYNVNFYKHINFASELETADRARLEAALDAAAAAPAAVKPRVFLRAVSCPVEGA